MLTFRNVVAIGVFLFGTTYLWLTPAFAGNASKDGLWTVVQVLAFAAIIGFAAAAWGIFKATAWWEPVAIGAAVVGMASVIPYWIAFDPLAGASRIAMFEKNIAIHLLGGAVVVAALLLPPAEHWIARHL